MRPRCGGGIEGGATWRNALCEASMRRSTTRCSLLAELLQLRRCRKQPGQRSSWVRELPRRRQCSSLGLVRYCHLRRRCRHWCGQSLRCWGQRSSELLIGPCGLSFGPGRSDLSGFLEGGGASDDLVLDDGFCEFPDTFHGLLFQNTHEQ